MIKSVVAAAVNGLTDQLSRDINWLQTLVCCYTVAGPVYCHYDPAKMKIKLS